MAGPQIRIGVLIVLFLGTFAAVSGASRYKQKQTRHVDWDRVPNQLGDWLGREAQFDPIFGVDPADSSFLRLYRHPSQPWIMVYSGFHRDLPTTLDYHTPEICYPAQGWEIVSLATDRVGVFRNRLVQGREAVVQKQGEQRLVLWWYHAGPRPFEKRIRQVYGLVAMSLLTGRTDGAIVRVETPITREGQQAARNRVLSFSRGLLTALEKALPQ